MTLYYISTYYDTYVCITNWKLCTLLSNNYGVLLLENDIFRRFSLAERSRRASKKSLFQLGDEEETLTHSGRAISEIERFEDPRSDDEGDDEGSNKKLNGKKDLLVTVILHQKGVNKDFFTNLQLQKWSSIVKPKVYNIIFNKISGQKYPINVRQIDWYRLFMKGENTLI